jgi:predicted XRE-type DNA-binding protein
MPAYVEALETARPARFNPKTIDDIKSRLSVLIREHVRACYRSQYEAAQTLGTTQPQINDVVNGKIAGVSIDYLFRLALKAKLIRKIEVQVEP